RASYRLPTLSAIPPGCIDQAFPSVTMFRPIPLALMLKHAPSLGVVQCLWREDQKHTPDARSILTFMLDVLVSAAKRWSNCRAALPFFGAASRKDPEHHAV